MTDEIRNITGEVIGIRSKSGTFLLETDEYEDGHVVLYKIRYSGTDVELHQRLELTVRTSGIDPRTLETKKYNAVLLNLS